MTFPEMGSPAPGCAATTRLPGRPKILACSVATAAVATASSSLLCRVVRVVMRELALIVDAAENLELRGRGRLRPLAGGVTAGRATASSIFVNLPAATRRARGARAGADYGGARHDARTIEAGMTQATIELRCAPMRWGMARDASPRIEELSDPPVGTGNRAYVMTTVSVTKTASCSSFLLNSSSTHWSAASRSRMKIVVATRTPSQFSDLARWTLASCGVAAVAWAFVEGDPVSPKKSASRAGTGRFARGGRPVDAPRVRRGTAEARSRPRSRRSSFVGGRCASRPGQRRPARVPRRA